MRVIRALLILGLGVLAGLLAMQIYVKVAWPPLPVDAGPDSGAYNQHPEIIQAAMQCGLLVALAVVVVGAMLVVVRSNKENPRLM